MMGSCEAGVLGKEGENSGGRPSRVSFVRAVAPHEAWPATECRTAQLGIAEVAFPGRSSSPSSSSLPRSWIFPTKTHHDTITTTIITIIMAEDNKSTALDKPTPVDQSANRITEHSSSTSPNTSPPARMIDDLKIVHESPEGASVQRERRNNSPVSREELLEQATKFLESSPIKNAPLKEKLEFLHTKGLTKDETEALLAKLEEKEGKGKGKQVCHG